VIQTKQVIYSYILVLFFSMLVITEKKIIFF